jgi:hypothetical protein
MTTNRLAKSEVRDDDPHSIERMPGYMPPKLRKNWSPGQHCQFANDQLAWRGINEERRMKGLRHVRWVVCDGRVILEPA